MAPRGRATQQSRDTRKTNQAKQPAHFSQPGRLQNQTGHKATHNKTQNNPRSPQWEQQQTTNLQEQNHRPERTAAQATSVQSDQSLWKALYDQGPSVSSGGKLILIILWECANWFESSLYTQANMYLISRGTKVEKMLTLAPERYTAGFRMVAKVILWCIWNHCIADSIDLHNVRAVNFLRKPSKIMSKYYFSKCYIFLSKNFRAEKYWVYIIIQHRRRPQKQWWSSKNTAIDF